MTPTFVALGIFIIVAGLAIHVWHSNSRRQKGPYEVSISFNDVDVTHLFSNIKMVSPNTFEIHGHQIQPIEATIVWEVPPGDGLTADDISLWAWEQVNDEQP